MGEQGLPAASGSKCRSPARSQGAAQHPAPCTAGGGKLQADCRRPPAYPAANSPGSLTPPLTAGHVRLGNGLSQGPKAYFSDIPRLLAPARADPRGQSTPISVPAAHYATPHTGFRAARSHHPFKGPAGARGPKEDPVALGEAQKR